MTPRFRSSGFLGTGVRDFRISGFRVLWLMVAVFQGIGS